MNNGGWIGVDFDGTLAFYDRWRGVAHLGKPIPAMVKRVQHILSQGKTVKIFTARAHGATPAVIELIELWCEEHIGIRLEVTCIKDQGCIAIYDDRAYQVIRNTGKVVTVKNKMKEK